MLIKRLILIGILASYLFLIIQLLPKEPPAWPDEAIFVDVANNLLTKGVIGTHLWETLIPGADKNFAGYPLFHLINAFFISMTGISLINLRSVVAIFGLAYLVIYYLFAKNLLKIIDNKQSLLPVLPLGLLTLDFAFQKGTKLIRPEIYVVLFGTTALLLFLKILQSKSAFSQKIIAVFCGLFLSASFLIHFLGLIFPVSIALYLYLTSGIKAFKIKFVRNLLISFLVPIFIWLLTITPLISSQINQINLQLANKGVAKIWILETLKANGMWELKIIYSLLLLTTFFFLIKFLKSLRAKKQFNPPLLIAILLLFSWIGSALAKDYWYLLYPIPFVYLALMFLSAKTEAAQKFKKIWLLIAVLVGSILFATNIKLQLQLLQIFPTIYLPKIS